MKTPFALALVIWLSVLYSGISSAAVHTGPPVMETATSQQQVDEAVMQALSTGMLVIHCVPYGCFDFVTGEEYQPQGHVDMNNTLYFVDPNQFEEE